MDTKSLAPSEIGNRFRTLYLLVAIAALVPFLTERQLQRRTSPRPRGRALKYLSDHWPDDQEWPTEIPRPKDAARDRRRLRWSWRIGQGVRCIPGYEERRSAGAPGGICLPFGYRR